MPAACAHGGQAAVDLVGRALGLGAEVGALPRVHAHRVPRLDHAPQHRRALGHLLADDEERRRQFQRGQRVEHRGGGIAGPVVEGQRDLAPQARPPVDRPEEWRTAPSSPPS